ncbi:hypothetical protein [Paenibacillus wynnii]|uniref:Lipoprotein n=1 Tax=Paenibacillus wynnii TaxID=268407 RepID=A0A098M8Y5_9BACL|nr:hypothetical protein [Paenibacillus wynnii]KGE18513.1 hypothetical protein PWYN_03350 [Paenibacillus wynnii]
MKHSHSLPAMAAVAVLMLALTACGGNTPAAAPGESNNPAETATASASPSPVPTESVSPIASATPENEQPLLIKGTGIYVGQIDNHSVEIKTEEGSTAFELGEGTETAPETLNMDDPVVFEFVEKSVPGDDTLKQRVLSKLSLAPDASTGGVLPQSKTLKLNLEGNSEEKEAKLAKGEGYSLYVFDIFTFDSGSNKLAMKIDKNYYAEIIKLPSDFNLDYLLIEGREELAQTGKVKKLTEADRSVQITNARLYLSASGSNLTREYIVKEIKGQGYIIKLNIPQGEASEGFSPHVFASLNSIVSQ